MKTKKKLRKTILIINAITAVCVLIACKAAADSRAEAFTGLVTLRAAALVFCALCPVNAALIVYRRAAESLSPTLSPFRREIRAVFSVIIVFGAAALFSSVFFSGKLVYGHDLYYHLERIEGLAQGLAAGYFPVRIQPMWVNGCGYGVSLYYPDLFLYLPAILRLLGFGLQDAYLIFLFLLNTAVASVSYLCFLRMFKNNLCAAVGSVLYMLGEYRFSVTYVRASLGEFLAGIFFPMIFCGIYEIFTADTADRSYKKVWLLPAAGFACLFYCHNLSSLLAGFFTLLVCVLLIKRTLQPKRLLALTVTAVAAVLAAAAYLLPFADAMQWDTAISGYTFYPSGGAIGRLFEFLPDMVCDPLIGTVKGFAPEIVAFSPGPALLIGGAYAVLALYITRKKTDDATRKWRMLTITSLIGALALSFAETAYFPWDKLQAISASFTRIIGLIQFPFRLSMFSMLFFTVAALGALKLTLTSQPVFTRVFAAALVLTAGIFCCFWNNSFLTVNKKIDYVESGTIYSQLVMELFYCPAECDYVLFDYRLYYPTYGVTYTQTEKYALNLELYIQNDADEGFTWIEVPLIYYPSYRAYDADTGEALVLTKGDHGQLAIVLPSGYYGNVRIEYQPLRLWRVSEAVSLLALTGISVIIIIINVRDKKNRKTDAETQIG